MSSPNPKVRMHPFFLTRKRSSREPAHSLGLVPFPRLATYNVNSLSQYANTPDSLARRHNIISNIKSLLKKADIICLQETRLRQNDHGALCGALPSCLVLHAPGPNGRAGVAIIVNQRYHDAYHVAINTPTQLSGDSRGNLLSTIFTPREQTKGLEFQVINARLAPGQAHAAKKGQIKDIKRIERQRHSFLLGDFNFVEGVEDEQDSPNSRLDRSTSLAWADLLAHHRLREAHQPTHTYFRYYDNGRCPSSSRLDRIYYSHSESDLTIRTAAATIPSIPYSSLRQQQARQSGGSRSSSTLSSRCSDHSPVLLTFVSTAPRKGRAFNLPAWIFKLAGARALLAKKWEERGCPLDPFEALKVFAAVAKDTAKEVLRKKHRMDSASQLGKLSAAISLLRMLDSPHPSSKHLSPDSRPELAACFLSGRPDYERTSAFIKSIFANADYDASLRPDPRIRPPIDKVSNATIIKQAKLMFPSTRTRLTHLVLSEGLVTHPQRIARALRDAWQPIWNRRDDEATADEVDRWLGEMPTIDDSLLPIPPTDKGTPIDHADSDSPLTWADLINESILSTNDSTPGPDGIPFVVYRENTNIATPILLACLIALSEGVEPPSDFNAGRLFAIPKDSSYTPDATRPIVVNNSSNRIIARVIARIITPALQSFITEAQQGFVEGRQGGVHLRALNAHYYTAMRERRLEFVLFLDTRKAFDSIDHSFIHAVVRKAGFPRWLQLVIAALLFDAWVVPVVAEDTTVRISIRRGVKQGCPLSPLLFILCYDTLLRRLQALDATLVLGFADDLAVMAKSLNLIYEVMRLLDAFRRVSGLGINEDKTKILPSAAFGKQLQAELAADSPWPLVKLTRTYKYLGIHFGLGLTNVKVFELVYEKFKKRLRVYGTTIRYMPVHQRIILCNVFLLSLFSYHIEYCLIPYREMVLKVNGAIQRLIVPFKGFAYSHLTTPRDQLGFHQPLLDLWALNMARLARQGPSHYEMVGLSSVPIEGYEYLLDDSWQSLRHDDHIRMAHYEYYTRWAPRDEEGRFCGDLHGDHKIARKQVYKRLVDFGWRRERYDTEVKSSLTSRLASWGIRVDAKALATKIAKAIFKALPAHYVAHHRMMWFRVLPTDRRLVSARLDPQDTRQPEYKGTCYLCGARERGTDRGKSADSIKHIYGHCIVARRARFFFYRQLGLAPRGAHTLHHALIGYAPKTRDRLLVNLTLVFNHCLWDARTRYFRAHLTPPPTDVGARWILSLATTRWNERVGSYRGAPTFYHMDPKQRRITELFKRLSRRFHEVALHPGVPEVNDQVPCDDVLERNLRKRPPR